MTTIKVGMLVRVKRRADRDTATVVANVDGDARLVRLEPMLFGHHTWPRDALVRVPSERDAR